MPTQGPQSYSPVTTNEQWLKEPGFIDSFTSPNPTTGAEALRYGLMGAGTGAVGGAIADRNPWVSGGGTGLGSMAGYLLAHTLAQHKDVGTQNGYELLGSLLGGGAGFAATSKLKNKQKKQITLPGNLEITAKTAGFEDVLRTVHEQLPSIRLPDTLAGGAVGALGGLGYDALKSKGEKQLSKGEQHRNTFRRALIGAGLGVAGGNVAGDRFRRYISNNLLPYGYGQFHDTLRPKSFKHVWDSAIMDRPQFHQIQDYQAGHYDAPYTEDPSLPFHNTKANLAARYELNRRNFGLHVENPAKDIFATQPDGTVSLNPRHTNAQNMVQELMFPKTKEDQTDMMTIPLGAVAGINEFRPDSRPGLMQEVTGGQRITVSPSYGKNGLDFNAKILDEQNYAPRSNERHAAVQYLKDSLFGTPHEMYGVNAYDQGSSPLKQFAKRWLLQNVLMKKAPWVSQRMYFKHTPEGAYDAVPTTASGELYPGNTVGHLSDKGPEFVNSSGAQ